MQAQEEGSPEWNAARAATPDSPQQAHVFKSDQQDKNNNHDNKHAMEDVEASKKKSQDMITYAQSVINLHQEVVRNPRASAAGKKESNDMIDYCHRVIEIHTETLNRISARSMRSRPELHGIAAPIRLPPDSAPLLPALPPALAPLPSAPIQPSMEQYIAELMRSYIISEQKAPWMAGVTTQHDLNRLQWRLIEVGG